jgi:transcriptional regulator GlxA family with amidase domain/YHS domain-containing protein
MKKLLALLLLISWLRPAQAQTSPANGPQRLNVAFVVFPGMEALDMTGPLDVLVNASNLTNGGYHCYTVALTDSLLATDRGGLRLKPDYTFATAPRPDLVVVPGGPGVARCQQNPAFVAQFKALSGRATQTMSVCTGALLLAKAGVLDGHRATTHQGSTDELARQFPRVQVVRDVRYVVDGPVLTTAGVTAGIDGAFYLVEHYSGATVAEVVASTMQYPRLNAAQAQQPSAHPAANLFAQAAPPKGKPATAAPGAALASTTDPVCHMGITAATKHRATYKGKTYGFCSEGCRKVFAAKPQQYVP